MITDESAEPAEDNTAAKESTLAEDSTVSKEVSRKTRSWPLFAAIAGQAAITLFMLLTFGEGSVSRIFIWLGYSAVVGGVSAACKACGIAPMRWIMSAPVASVVILVLAFIISTGGSDIERDSLDEADGMVILSLGVLLVAGATLIASMTGAAMGWAGFHLGSALGRARIRQ